MDLSIYNIIIGPVVTSKAYTLNKKLRKLVLWVHPSANKSLVKKAFKKIFNVEVEDVNILVREGKFRKAGRKTVQGSSRKQAIVTLAEGHSLDLFGQVGTAHERTAETKEIA